MDNRVYYVDAIDKLLADIRAMLNATNNRKVHQKWKKHLASLELLRGEL